MFLLVKYYWTIRYWLYRNLGKRAQQDQRELQQLVYRYDGFIVYSSEDRGWVHHTLREEMEEKRGLKLCIYMRDVLAGGVLADRIDTAMQESRKTVIVLSPNFVQSEWCQFDMHMAENRLMADGVDVVVPVILKNIPLLEVNQAVKRQVQRPDCLKWTSNRVGQQMFWDKLQQALLSEPMRPLRA